MKAKASFQWIMRAFLILVVVISIFSSPNNSVSAKPLGDALCAAQTQIPAAECNALVALYNETDGANWADNAFWMQTDRPCSWAGVDCRDGTNVTELHLNNNKLSGFIPPELGNLANLENLLLNTNQLSGSIPPELGNLTRLYDLSLSFNQLSGSIPPELGSLTRLGWLVLYGNQLTGSIPSELGNLNLYALYLNNNQLSGSIPPGLGSLTHLNVLYLSNNQLSGSIPPELGSLTSLTQLDLSVNHLSGSLPTELGSLTNLWVLLLNNNLLTGEIPVSFTNLTGLSSSYFALSCGLTSTNPAVISFVDGILGVGWNVACGPPTNITLSQKSVAENKPIGSLVGTLTTIDPNVGDTFTYSFACAAPGANDSLFAIAGNNLNTAASFNFEVKNSYAICIRADDGNGGTFDKSFAITVTNVFDKVTKNGGFNTYAGTSKIPTNWVKSATFASTDGKDTTVKKEGTASVKITGNGKLKTLTQTLVFSGKTGDKFTFTFWVKGASIPITAGLCQGQVLLYSGTTLKLTKTISCANGTYATFQKKTLTFNATSVYTKVVIKFTYSKASGTVWFDLVSLLR